MFKVKFTCIRPDTSAPFFHDAPENAEYQKQLLALRAPGGLVLAVTESWSEDLLTWVAVFSFATPTTYREYVAKLKEIAGLDEARTAYYQKHHHKVTVTGQLEGAEQLVMKRVNC